MFAPDLFGCRGTVSGGLLADCRLLSDSVAFAKVIDADGRHLTAMAFEAEQYRVISPACRPIMSAKSILVSDLDRPFCNP
jgi:hypothetical protein